MYLKNKKEKKKKWKGFQHQNTMYIYVILLAYFDLPLSSAFGIQYKIERNEQRDSH